MFLDQFLVLYVGNDKDVFCWNYLAISVESQLQKRVPGSEKIEELFGLVLAAIWPKSASDATGHNNAVVIAVRHDRLGFKVSAKLRLIFVIASIFVINDVIITFFEENMGKILEVKKKVVPLHPQLRNKPRIRNAQMAESVDALVSNTSGFTSIPVRPRVWVQDKPPKLLKTNNLGGFLFVVTVT